MSVERGRTSLGSATAKLRVGDAAPDFELSGHIGKDKVRLSDFRGRKNVVLAFYPLDWTGVWSVQMSSYQAEHARFEEYDAQVLGVSIDSVPSHRAFAESLGGINTYPLLADFHPKGEVARAYGVFKEDSGYTERALFLIDKQGVVRFIDVHAGGEQPDNEQILEELHKLS